MKKMTVWLLLGFDDSDDGNGSVGNYDDSDDGDLNMSVMAMNVMM